MKVTHGLVCCLIAMGVSAFADAPVLIWAPAGGAVWDLTSANWLDERDAPTAWVQGAVAVFDGAGGFVDVRADVSAGGVVFETGKYALVGGGRVRLEGDLFVAAGATNSVGTELFTAGGIAKTGAGAVALGKCVGRVAVAEGDLLATASELADAELAVAPGARLVTVGGPERGAANLISNGGFEANGVGDGTHQYVSNGARIEGWGVQSNPERVALQNIATRASPWNSAGVAPEGAQVLILQFSGAVTQAVTVAQAGWHQAAFSYFLRKDYPEVMLYVTLDGVPVAALLNDVLETAARRFVSVPLWLEPGEYVLGIASEKYWCDRASMVDDVCFGPVSAGTACRALGGVSSVALAAGAEAALDHTGNLDVARLDVAVGATVSGGGSWAASPAGLWHEYAGGAWAPPLTMGPGAELRIRDSGALTAEGLAQRVWVSDAAGGVTLGGTGLTLTNMAPAMPAWFSVTDASAVSVTEPLTLRQQTTFDVFGSLAIAGGGNVTNAPISKRGFGAMSIDHPLGLLHCVNVTEGRLRLAHVLAQTTTTSFSQGRGGFVWVLSQQGRTAEVCLPQAGVTHTLGLAFGGGGRCVLSTDVGGGTVAVGHLRTVMESQAELLVAGADTLSIRQLLIWTGAPNTSGGWIKSGSGTLEIKEGGFNNSGDRAHNGRPVLRNGTVRVLADDTGNLTGAHAYTGTSPDGRGGSLGFAPLSTAMWIGDEETQPGDDLTFVAVGNKRFIGRDFEVFDRGDAVRFEMEDTAETMFAGTFTLHRGVTFAGPAGAHLILGSIATAAGNQGAVDVALEGVSQVTITNALSADINLDAGSCVVSIGPTFAGAMALRSFAMAGGTFRVAVEGGACTRLDAADVTLGTVAFDLCYRGTDMPFCEPGTYTLMTGSGTLAVNPALLSVTNAVAGFSYAFAVSGNALTVTIQSVNPSAYAVWGVQQGGAWNTGGNWQSGTAPDSSAVSALLGSAIAENATVTLGTPVTVGALIFNHTAWGYTLAGDTLTIGGSPARVDVLNGSHTVKNTLDASEPLSVAVANGKLTVDGQGTILPRVLVEQGTLALAGEGTLPSGATLADGGTLAVSGTNTAVGTGLDGAAGAALAFQDKGRLTLAGGGMFSGTLSGPATAELVSGGGTLTLAGHGSTYEGAFRQASGTTVLAGASLLGAVTADAGTALTAAPAATNGLMGYYYIGNPQANSNAFLTVAGLEAYVAGRKPDLIAPSGFDNAEFNYPLTSGSALAFPYPFGKGGPNTTYFTAVWRGSITVPETGSYGFSIEADDFALVAIDGAVLYATNRCVSGSYYRAMDLSAGRHDILIALGQAAGSVGIRLLVFPPSHAAGGSHFPTPNSWLTPMSTLGSVSSKGLVTLADNVNVQAGLKGSGVLSGTLDTGAGALLEKTGTGLLDLRGGTPSRAAGDVSVRAGKLALARPGLLGPASRVAVYDGAAVAVLAPQTLGSLTGDGHTLLGSDDGGAAGVDMFAFTDETDIGISPTKHYTHLVDFPMNQALVATVNGVTFNKNGNWSYVAGTGPNGSQVASAETGLERLLRGFVYNQKDYTLRLTGLQPFAAHEFRFYFRSFSNPLNERRDVEITFSLSGNGLGSVRYSLDAIPRSQVRCRYVTDATGTLDIRVFSHLTDTAHIYAFSNEALGGDVFDAPPPTLTLAPPAGTDARYAGSFGGDGALVKAGAGIQRFSGRNDLGGAFTVQSGEAVLERGAVIANAPAVAAGATLSTPLGGVTLGGLTGGGTFSMSDIASLPQGTIYQHFFTDDAGSLISPEKVYTHKLDFGNRGILATINGVEFVKAGKSGTANGYGWSEFGAGPHGGGVPPVVAASEGVYNLLYDMVYNAGNGTLATAQLTGLTPGKQYELRIYQRIWATDQSRRQTVSFIPAPGVTHTITFNEDKLPPHFLAYRYTPASPTLTIQYTTTSGATWHFYGLTNEEVTNDDANAVVFDMAGNSTFAGTATGWQFWKKRGPGTLLMTGLNTAAGPLTVEGGAFGVGADGVATCGPVTVLDGLLFGQGAVGGAVDIASGAWLQAGMPAACGTLAIGGDLTLAPGANVKFRYASPAQADTFTVGGVLTLSEAGTVTAAALTGANSPTKWLLFSTGAVINGPADFSAWTIDGLPRASLVYSADRTQVYVREARGTMLLLQ